ncbi:MAG: hypothetical protein M3R41_10540, partial [Pseudomonadota bacterium]|nr:hypothetical protein [Pseudomonadota bacterium]
MVLRDRWQAFDIASVAVLSFVLYKGARDPALEYSRNLLLSALFLLAVFLLLPRVVFGSAYADMRLAPFMLALAVIAVRPKPGLSIRHAATLAAVGFAFFLVRIGGTTASYYYYDQTVTQTLRALDHIPQGARLVSFVGRRCPDTWGYSRLEHIPGLALERKEAYSNDQWSMPGAQLLTAHYAMAGHFAHDPSQIVTDEWCRGEWWWPITTSLSRLPRDAFDYVWLIHPPAYPAKYNAGLVEIWHDGPNRLYRIDHAKRGPDVPDAEIMPPWYHPRPAGTESASPGTPGLIPPTPARAPDNRR